MSKKIITLFLSIVLIAVFGVCVYCFWPSIEAIILGKKSYSAKAVEESYNNGFNDGSKSEDKLTSQVTFYKNLIDDYENTIASLNSQIDNLSSSISELEFSCGGSQSEIEALSGQLSSLLLEKSQLESSLQDYIDIVDSYRGDGVIVTFIFNDQVYSCIQTEVGGVVSVDAPQDTEKFHFNGWTIDGESIDLENYSFTTDTTVVADLTHYYSVNFYVGASLSKTIYVESGGLAENYIPTSPNGTFSCWVLSTDNSVVDLETYVITQDTSFKAVFSYSFDGNWNSDYGYLLINNSQVEDGAISIDSFDGFMASLLNYQFNSNLQYKGVTSAGFSLRNSSRISAYLYNFRFNENLTRLLCDFDYEGQTITITYSK